MMKLTVKLCMATFGNGELRRLMIDLIHSFGPFGSVPTRSQMSIITAQSSVVFDSLVAFSVKNQINHK